MARPTSRPRIMPAHQMGKAPLAARQMVKMVMSILSAMGSITVPTTVLLSQRRAIHPSSKSVMPAYAKRPTAHACWSYRTRYPMTGAAARRVKVRMLGTVYMSSCSTSAGREGVTSCGVGGCVPTGFSSCCFLFCCHDCAFVKKRLRRVAGVVCRGANLTAAGLMLMLVTHLVAARQANLAEMLISSLDLACACFVFETGSCPDPQLLEFALDIR